MPLRAVRSRRLVWWLVGPGCSELLVDRIDTRAALADGLRLIAAGIRLDGTSDHDVSEALYLRDPDQDGVELHGDRPKEQCPRDTRGGLALFTRRLDW